MGGTLGLTGRLVAGWRARDVRGPAGLDWMRLRLASVDAGGYLADQSCLGGLSTGSAGCVGPRNPAVQFNVLLIDLAWAGFRRAGPAGLN
jgi:hypothetical protein